MTRPKTYGLKQPARQERFRTERLFDEEAAAEQRAVQGELIEEEIQERYGDADHPAHCKRQREWPVREAVQQNKNGSPRAASKKVKTNGNGQNGGKGSRKRTR